MGLDVNDLGPEARALFDGQVGVPDGVALLEDHSEEVVTAVLGKTRAGLWRQGRLELEQLVDRGRETTLADLP